LRCFAKKRIDSGSLQESIGKGIECSEFRCRGRSVAGALPRECALRAKKRVGWICLHCVAPCSRSAREIARLLKCNGKLCGDCGLRTVLRVECAEHARCIGSAACCTETFRKYDAHFEHVAIARNRFFRGHDGGVWVEVSECDFCTEGACPCSIRSDARMSFCVVASGGGLRICAERGKCSWEQCGGIIGRECKRRFVEGRCLRAISRPIKEHGCEAIGFDRCWRLCSASGTLRSFLDKALSFARRKFAACELRAREERTRCVFLYLSKHRGVDGVCSRGDLGEEFPRNDLGFTRAVRCDIRLDRADGVVACRA
jgi:hypothetical protein